MGMGDELGLLAPGYLADLLVVRLKFCCGT